MADSPNQAADALRWRWWLANGLRVARDQKGDWTCWIEIPFIPFRSQTNDPCELTDALLARFPLDGKQSLMEITGWRCGWCGSSDPFNPCQSELHHRERERRLNQSEIRR